MKSTEDEGILTMATVKGQVNVWEEERKKKTPRFLQSYLPELKRKKNVFCDRYNMNNMMVEKLRILRKNMFGKSQTNYTPSGIQKIFRSRKSGYTILSMGKGA